MTTDTGKARAELDRLKAALTMVETTEVNDLDLGDSGMHAMKVEAKMSRARLMALLAPIIGRAEAAGDALDEICKMIGAPEWEYPGQVVRDVAHHITAAPPAEDIKPTGCRDRLLILAVPLAVRLKCGGPFTRSEVEELGDGVPIGDHVLSAMPAGVVEQRMAKHCALWANIVAALASERHRGAYDLLKDQQSATIPGP